jgi:hypothetical protein
MEDLVMRRVGLGIVLGSALGMLIFLIYVVLVVLVVLGILGV